MVDAVVATGALVPKEVYRKIGLLAGLKDAGDLEPVLTTFKRVANIVNSADFERRSDYGGLFEDEAPAKTLLSAFLDARSEGGDETAQLTALRPTVDHFFDEVLVMSDDQDKREGLLSLLADIRDQFRGFADFSRIQDRK